MLPDLHTTRHLLRTGQTDPTTEIERAIDVAQSARCTHVFLKPMFDEARVVATTGGIRETPLAGLRNAAARIQRGATMSACDYIELLGARRHWITGMGAAMQGFDVFLSPAVPMAAPPIARVAPGPDRDDAFFDVNARRLRPIPSLPYTRRVACWLDGLGGRPARRPGAQHSASD